MIVPNRVLETAPRGGRWVDVLWFLICAGLSSAWCLSAAAQLGFTFDEAIYLERGLECWRKGTHAPLMRCGTMPLPTDLCTLPLYLYEQYTGTTFDITRGDQLTPLFWARTTTLLFWWLLLGMAFLIARSIAGSWGGRLAVAFLAVEPNFLAHASLATTDIAAAATLLLVAWSFARGRDGGRWARIGLPGLCFGLALFTKASALVFGPLVWLLTELHRLYAVREEALTPTPLPEYRERGPWPVAEYRERGQWPVAEHRDGGKSPALACRDEGQSSRVAALWRALGPFRRDALRVGLIGLAIVFVLVGSDWQPDSSFIRWCHTLADGPFKNLMLGIANGLRIFTNAGNGLGYQIKHNLAGHCTYLLGESDARKLWWYWPVLYSIKLPEPWLVLPVVLAVLRPRSLNHWVCIAAAGLGLYSLTCKVQIGIRLMLPWVALGIVGLAASLVLAWHRRRSAGVRLVLAGAIVGTVGWLGMASATLWPDALRYANRFWGGPEHAYQLVSDSNYDWGQGLPELARWQREHGIDHLSVWYFGTDPAIKTLPVRAIPLALRTSVSELHEQTRGRYLAVNVLWIYGAYALDNEARIHLRSLTPVARTSTFLIFDFTNE